MAMVMRKEQRDALKKLKPVAEALGVTLGEMTVGGSHIRLPCTRADGSAFIMTLPISGSDHRVLKNLVGDLKKMAKKNDHAPL